MDIVKCHGIKEPDGPPNMKPMRYNCNIKDPDSIFIMEGTIDSNDVMKTSAGDYPQGVYYVKTNAVAPFLMNASEYGMEETIVDTNTV